MGKKYEPFKKGEFHPIHPEKMLTNTKQIFRSSWELKLAMWCDRNPNIVKWGLEAVAIQYYDPVAGRKRRYFIDFKIIAKNKHGKLITTLVEVKPHKQTLVPKKHGNMKESTYVSQVKTYATNKAKWEAAVKYCKSKGYVFKIITEKELFTNY